MGALAPLIRIQKELTIQALKLQSWSPGYDAVPRLSFRSLENYETQPNTLRGTKSCNAMVKQIHKVCFSAKRLKCVNQCIKFAKKFSNKSAFSEVID